MIKKGYKITALGQIPEEWEIKRLGEVTNILTGGTPDTKQREYWENGTIPWMPSGDINQLIIRNVSKNITEEGMKNSPAKNIPKDSIMIALNGQGKTKGMVGLLEIDTTCNQSLAGVLPSNHFNSKFLFYQLQNRYIEIRNLAGTDARNGLNLSLLKEIEIVLPRKKEQKKIGEILYNVDEQIEITDNLIEKTKELKKGLMQRLLTKGIGHSRFKDTEIGRIPEEWQVKRLGEVCEVKGGKRLPKGLQLIDDNNGYPYIRVSDMYMGGINKADIKYLPLEAVEAIKNYKINSDDLFISVAGTIGIVGEVPEGLDGANLTENADKLCNIKTNKNFLLWVLQSDIIQGIIDNEKTTNAQPKLALTRIKEFLLPIPSKKEQAQISLILSSINKQIKQYESKKEKLQELKKGLMQKLLTGSIRVKV